MHDLDGPEVLREATNTRFKRPWIRASAFPVVLLLMAAVLGLFLAECSKPAANKPSGAPTLRLGWQPPWANQGQIVEVLKHSDLLTKAGISVEFVPFSYGGPMMEAAVANQIDIAFAGEQPVLTLVSKSADWRIVARMTQYRSAIVVPVGSPIRSLSDLRGKTIATAFGSTTHRDLVRVLSDAGLEGAVTLVSLDQAEHAAVIQKGGTEKWGELDAIGTYDPTIAAAVARGQARVLYAWASPGLVAAREKIIRERRPELEKFLLAYVDAYAVYAKDPARANAWYSGESRLPLTDSQYAEIAAFEPNMSAKDAAAVDVRITDEVIRNATRNADVALKLGILKSKLDVRILSDLTLLR